MRYKDKPPDWYIIQISLGASSLGGATLAVLRLTLSDQVSGAQ